jgi:hypothetical protein
MCDSHQTDSLHLSLLINPSVLTYRRFFLPNVFLAIWILISPVVLLSHAYPHPTDPLSPLRTAVSLHLSQDKDVMSRRESIGRVNARAQSGIYICYYLFV